MIRERLIQSYIVHDIQIKTQLCQLELVVTLHKVLAMRLVEFFIIAAVSTLCGIDPYDQESSFITALAICFCLVIAHHFLHKTRWQLIPTYIALFLVTNQFVVYYMDNTYEYVDITQTPVHFLADFFISIFFA